LGTGNQEAFQILQNGQNISYGLAYLALFAIPLLAPGEKPFWALRVAAVSGFLMTLLNVVLSLWPIIDVPNPLAFAIKVGGLVIALNLAGAWLYRRGEIRRKRELG